MTIDMGWTVSPLTQEDVLRGHIVFVPNERTPKCGAIKMVQAAKVLGSPDVFDDIAWDANSGNYDRNFIRTLPNEERGVVGGYFIDYLSSNCRRGDPCSPFFRDHFANANESQDGVKDDQRAAPASIVDYPFGWTKIYSIALETCSVCVSGDASSVLGCIKWGATWPLNSPRYLNRTETSDNPSRTFTAAYSLFSRYYSNLARIHEEELAVDGPPVQKGTRTAHILFERPGRLSGVEEYPSSRWDETAERSVVRREEARSVRRFPPAADSAVRPGETKSVR